MNYNDLERLKREVVARCKKRLEKRGKPLDDDEKSTSELLRRKHNI